MLENYCILYKKVEVMNFYGNNIQISVQGEKHGADVLVGLSGLPAGLPLDVEAAFRAAARQVPGMSEMGAEPELVAPALLCGLCDGVTTGEGLTAVLRCAADPPQTGNVPRPGHEDLAAMARYGETRFTGGAYSPRLGMAVAFLGALCMQILSVGGIEIAARLVEVGGERGEELDFNMRRALLDARGNGDSVGGVVECAARGLPAGLGSPAFDGVDARIAGLLFALPGVKAVEFGEGCAFAAMRGSAANDQIVLREGRVVPETNHSGGVDGGMTTGAPLTLRVTLRPNPDVGREQRSVELTTMEEIPVRRRGRHEPCLAPRSIPAVEGAVAFCLLDAMLDPGRKQPRESGSAQ